MERRGFILSGISASIFGFFNYKADSTKRLFNSSISNGGSNYLLIHGDLRRDSIAGISNFYVEKPNKLLNLIKDVRTEFQFHSQIKYSSSDKFKVAPVKKILEGIINEIQIQLNLGILLNPDLLFKGLGPKKFNEERLKKMEELAVDLGSKTFVKSESIYGPSVFFKDKFEKKFGGTYKSVNAKQEEIIQLSDLIFGSLFSELRGNVKSPIKIELRDFIKEKFEINHVTPGIYSGGKLKIINI